MRIALLTTDNREDDRQYEKEAPYFGTAPEALIQGFALMPDVEVHVLSCAKRVMKSPAKLAENVHFHSLVVPALGWLRTGYQGCIRAVRRKLRDLQPDIVHGQGTERDCSLSAIFSGFPNVLTLHGNMRTIAQLYQPRPFSYLWLAARLEKLTIPRADGVVCITHYTRDLVAPLARKTWVVPNAADIACFDVGHLASPRMQILCVGKVDVRKNQNAFIRALDGLNLPENLELVFLGAVHPESEYGREFLGLVGTRPWCRQVGFVNRPTLREYLASAAGLVLPSLEDNCPMAVLEAMASGVPVAAAQVGGVPDLITHGETGLLFDPLDAVSMAGAMQRLIGPDAPALATRARDEARRRFHPEVVATRHLEMYREVISARPR